MALIVIEGIDGSGKSTQVKMLQQYCLEQNIICRYLHFPRTESPFFGELVARFLRGEFGNLSQVDPYLVAMLYAGDRWDAKEMISDWLTKGYFVLLDRYMFSNVAFQCAKIEDEINKRKLMNWIIKLEFDYFKIPVPDVNFFLDVPFFFTENKLKESRSGSDRDYLQGARDIHEESLEFQRKVKNVYQLLSFERNDFVRIDCHENENKIKSPEIIFNMILSVLKAKRIL